MQQKHTNVLGMCKTFKAKDRTVLAFLQMLESFETGVEKQLLFLKNPTSCKNVVVEYFVTLTACYLHVVVSMCTSHSVERVQRTTKDRAMCKISSVGI